MTTYHVARHEGQVFTRSSDTKTYGYCTVRQGPDGTWGALGWSTKQANAGTNGGTILIADIVTKAEYDEARGIVKSPKVPAVLPVDDEAVRDSLGEALFRGPYETREAWMVAFSNAARPWFTAAGGELPYRVRVSVGFPSKGTRSKVVGECWSAGSSSDGICEIFIRPSLQSDSARVADVLTHELIHAALGHEEGHGKTFGRVARALGLEGKLTATTAGERWFAWAQPILDALGPLPGASLGVMELAGGKKTQTTRYLKVACTSCDWTARVTAKHLATEDTLSCPRSTCDGELEQAA